MCLTGLTIVDRKCIVSNVLSAILLSYYYSFAYGYTFWTFYKLLQTSFGRLGFNRRIGTMFVLNYLLSLFITINRDRECCKYIINLVHVYMYLCVRCKCVAHFIALNTLTDGDNSRDTIWHCHFSQYNICCFARHHLLDIIIWVFLHKHHLCYTHTFQTCDN